MFLCGLTYCCIMDFFTCLEFFLLYYVIKEVCLALLSIFLYLELILFFVLIVCVYYVYFTYFLNCYRY